MRQLQHAIVGLACVLLLHCGVAHCASAEYDALSTFYNATEGAAWRNNNGWLEGEPCIAGSSMRAVANPLSGLLEVALRWTNEFLASPDSHDGDDSAPFNLPEYREHRRRLSTISWERRAAGPAELRSLSRVNSSVYASKWHGVYCHQSDDTVAAIHLSRNRLGGVLPANAWVSLTGLVSLYVCGRWRDVHSQRS